MLAMASVPPFEVELYVYDISKGLARTMSLALIGHQIDGIWHTGVVVYGREYFYGVQGIHQCPPGGTVLGQPNQIIHLGTTEITKDIFLQHLHDLGQSAFRATLYDLFTHNCNNFSNEVANFLISEGIPGFILDLPQTVLNTPLGQLLKQVSQTPLLQDSRERGGSDLTLFGFPNIEPANNMSNHEQSPSPPAEASGRPRRDVVAESRDAEEEEKREREEKKKNREPPIVFKDLGNSVDELLDDLERSLANVDLNDEEMRCMRELREYALGDEGSWVLSDEFLNLIGRILLSSEPGIGDDSRVHCLKVLAWLSVTKDDVILVLHQDRRDHVLMRYATNIDQLSPQCQESVALLLCNLFENLSTSEWLLYISEWENTTGAGGLTSNIRVTTKVGVHALLSKEFKDIGSALVYNMMSKEVKTAVFDDVAVEMAMALLQFLSEKPPELLCWRGLKSLLRCCQLARSEVPSLVKMVGPQPSEFKGCSARCDELIDQINAILATVSG